MDHHLHEETTTAGGVFIRIRSKDDEMQLQTIINRYYVGFAHPRLNKATIAYCVKDQEKITAILQQQVGS